MTEDKLQVLIVALRKKPNMTNEEIAKLLGLQRPASAIAWKVKAKQVLQQK